MALGLGGNSNFVASRASLTVVLILNATAGSLARTEEQGDFKAKRVFTPLELTCGEPEQKLAKRMQHLLAHAHTFSQTRAHSPRVF